MLVLMYVDTLVLKEMMKCALDGSNWLLSILWQDLTKTISLANMLTKTKNHLTSKAIIKLGLLNQFKIDINT